MRTLALILVFNMAAAAMYAWVAGQLSFFNHLSETLFSSPDSQTYHDVANWLFGTAPNPVESQHRPFLYPLLLGLAERVSGTPGIWALNLLCWFGMLNVTAAATWRMTGRPLLAAIVFLGMATNISLIVLSFQALTEALTAFLESLWILGLAVTVLPPFKARHIALLLLPIALLTVVKPGYQLELLIAFALLAITVWRWRRGRAMAIVAVAASCTPVIFQLGLMATANHTFGLSSTGGIELKNYYASQVYASINGLPDDLVAARVDVDRMSDSEVVAFLFKHPGPAIGTLVANLHGNLTSGSNFVDPAKTPFLADAVRDANRAYLKLHVVFLPLVAIAIWFRRDVRLLLLYSFAVMVTLVPSLIVDQGDRYILMALPLWAAAYALTISDLLAAISETLARRRAKSAEGTAVGPHA